MNKDKLKRKIPFFRKLELFFVGKRKIIRRLIVLLFVGAFAYLKYIKKIDVDAIFITVVLAYILKYKHNG